jgi:hypothetical protein
MKRKIFLFIAGVFFICSAMSNIKAMPATDWPPSFGGAAAPQSPSALRPDTPSGSAAGSSADAAEVESIPLPINGAPVAPTRRPPPITDPDAPVVFSRIVKATVGQQIEIPFGGSGWVFLGEQNSQKGVAYTSHRLEAEGQSFVFSADKAGTYALKFYKQDFIRDYILNDNVQVIIADPPAATVSGHSAVDRSMVKATPRWPTAAQEAALASGLLDAAYPAAGAASTPSSPAQTTPAGSASALPQGTSAQSPPSAATPASPNAAAPSASAGVPQSADAATPAASPQQAADALPADASPDEYLKKAQTTYTAGDIASTLSILDKFRNQYPLGNDEAWWLYAQALEANGPNKDIRSARDYYQRLVREYPLSPHYAEAQSRIKYINKYYFNIQ